MLDLDCVHGRFGTLLTTCCVALVLSGCGEMPKTETASTPVPTAPSNSPSMSTTPVQEGFTETSSGLRYKVLKESDGKKPAASNTVTVNYRGWLDDGSEFDAGEGITFGLGDVIAGWTEGLQLVGEGGEIELEIPAGLAYGNQNLPGIPAGSTLHFKVDLLKVQ